MTSGNYVEKTHTWQDNWRDVERYVIWQDEKLKELMMIPEGTTIVTFFKKYFMNNASGDEILSNEKVRVTYYDAYGPDSGNPGVRQCYKEFDIYVQEDYLHNATRDQLQNRCDLIAERLRYLLLKSSTVHGLRFSYRDEYGMWTKTIGYQRFHVVFGYKRTV